MNDIEPHVPVHRGRAIVHLLRHGEVENPTGVLYGRLPDFHLSERGRAMAERLGEHLADADLTHLRCSPLERAQETMAPVSAQHPDLQVVTDDRVVESANLLQGRVMSAKKSALRDPRMWWLLRNPTRPSWGEPYTEIVVRMRAAILDSAIAADGHEALIVSHQLPIWMARCDAVGRRLVHDPRRRQCTLASLTSMTVIDGRVVNVAYSEPAVDLLPAKGKGRQFVAGA
ncbi:histidine phosphatase family protein [Auraticoccus monumenti]|uniref:Broad specificity phosphatase PhoE n=1 Tax=Auraticoccus monumenti TaxID=675864 RepID=A0A1G6RJK4_9ACTN|nr:histidine phosphatase family protein [Auraticoccus monumenti]SDD04554.1 Broad specificity phosphatase PhoE [Auraticoccus monumenti]